MIIGITGHTEGLGEYLFNNLSTADNTLGYARSNGYSIEESSTILKDSSKWDVFINNAFHPIAQCKLFENLFTTWEQENKTIVNILTSAIIYGGSNKDYITAKDAIHRIYKDLKFKFPYKKVRVVNILPGTLESESVNIYNKVYYEDVLQVIKFAINQPQHIELSPICITTTTAQIEKQFI